jgi:uncharacterized protein (TIGR03066 family)
MKSRERKLKHAPNRLHGMPGKAGRGTTAPRSDRTRRKWVLVIAIIAIAFVASFAVFEFVLPGKLPSELVGEWRVVGGPMNGMTLQFKRNGTMIGKATVQGKDSEMEGQAEVAGNTLRTTTTNPFTGRPETGTQTIITLTETEFVTEDPKGTRITMQRIR